MSETVDYFLSAAYTLAAAQTIKTSDDRGGPTDRTVAAGSYRTFLAPTSGAAGTAADPAELLSTVRAALGSSKWNVTLGASGRVVVTYLGASTGTVDLSSSPTVRALLGFTGNIGPLATNASATATYPPTHCVLGYLVDPDTGWIDDPARFAGATLPDGTVYGWADGRIVLRRSCTWSALPKTTAFRTSLGAAGTPAFPDAAARLLAPSTGEPGQAPPWSVLDTQGTAAGRSCAVTWGDLQALIAGTATNFEVVYFAPSQFSSGQRLGLWREGYDARRSWQVELLYAGAGAR